MQYSATKRVFLESNNEMVIAVQAVEFSNHSDPPPVWTAEADLAFDWDTATDQNPQRSLAEFKFYPEKVPHPGEITFSVQGL
jgi:hypothetical protein